MALTDEEKAQLAALQAKESEPDTDSDFDIEIWDETGAGAKVPFSQGKKWLARFGIGVDDPTADSTDTGDKSKSTKSANAKTTDRPGTAQRYFGNKTKTDG